MHLKKLFLLIMFILLSTVAFAGQCYVGGDCYIYHEVADPVYDQVFVNVTASNGSVIFADNMSQQSGDLYFYVHNFADGGNYSAFIQVFNDSIEQSNTTKEFTVLAGGGLLTNLCPSTTATTITLWLFIAFFLVIAIVGFSMGNMFLSMIGGIGIVFASLVVIGCHTAMGLLVLAVGLILALYSLFVKV